jgi:putative DNA primase/helicase
MRSSKSAQATPTPSASVLKPNHIDELARSGITVETALSNGIYSETDQNRLAVLLGWSQARKLGGAIVFPFHDFDGRELFCRIKPDIPRRQAKTQRPIKYESPKGVPNRLYIPKDVRPLIGDGGELIFTEGEKKSLSATQHGFPAIGLVGVHGWKQKSRAELIPCFNQINMKGRQIRIVFDSDASEKAQIKSAECWLAHHLTDVGAIVRVVRLPDAPDGTKMGVDDFLVTEGPAELRKLLGRAAYQLRSCLTQKLAATSCSTTLCDSTFNWPTSSQ